MTQLKQNSILKYFRGKSSVNSQLHLSLFIHATYELRVFKRNVYDCMSIKYSFPPLCIPFAYCHKKCVERFNLLKAFWRERHENDAERKGRRVKK